MNAIAMDREYSVEDLLWIPDSHRYELVDGTIQIGWGFCADVGFQCYPSRPHLVRYPDVAVVCFGRLANEELPDGYNSTANQSG